MAKIAVIKTGGKQYLVKTGDKVKVEKLGVEQDKQVEFDVLLKSDDNGSNFELGKPLLKDKVKAKVKLQSRAKKVRVVHYKPKTRQHKVFGHRQKYSQVEIGAL